MLSFLIFNLQRNVKTKFNCNIITREIFMEQMKKQVHISTFWVCVYHISCFSIDSWYLFFSHTSVLSISDIFQSFFLILSVSLENFVLLFLSQSIFPFYAAWCTSVFDFSNYVSNLKYCIFVISIIYN